MSTALEHFDCKFTETDKNCSILEIDLVCFDLDFKRYISRMLWISKVVFVYRVIHL